MLFNGEQIGAGSPRWSNGRRPDQRHHADRAGQRRRPAVVAVAGRGAMFDPGPCVYMEKLAAGPERRGPATSAEPDREHPTSVRGSRMAVRDLTAIILDRPRHEDIITGPAR